MDKYIITEKLHIFEHVKVPFLNLIHDLKNIGPLPGIHIDYLPQTLLVFLYLILVCFSIFSVQFFQEIIQITLKPSCGVIYLLSRQINPGFSVNILLTFTLLIHCKLKKFVVFNYLSSKLSLLFNRVWNGELLELLKDVDDWLD